MGTKHSLSFMTFHAFMTIVAIWPVTAPAQNNVVLAKAEHDQREWKSYEIEATPIFLSQDSIDSWGGLKNHSLGTSGFFRATKDKNRWWLVDPSGNAFFSIGVNSVRPGLSKFTREQCLKRFGNETAWAEKTVKDLKALGFNTLGAWSNIRLLRATSDPLPYCSMGTEAIGGLAPTGFLQSFARIHKLGNMGYGHWKYPNDCLPVFHPAFPEFCERAASDFKTVANDPFLIGYFTDNELNLPVLKNYLELDDTIKEMESSRSAAWDWWTKRKGGMAPLKEITEEDEEAWVEYVFSYYFRIVTAAIRRYDSNHLILGSRFHGKVSRNPGAFRAAAASVDVISVNLYKVWQPEKERFSSWAQWADKPILVTEWYAKAEDSGLSNKKGAGWLVKTQEDRAQFYQTFTLGLMRQPNSVGFHWFRYTDDDPPDNGDLADEALSNKGIYTNFFLPYAPLATAIRTVNRHAYGLIELYAQKHSSASEEEPVTIEIGPDTN